MVGDIFVTKAFLLIMIVFRFNTIIYLTGGYYGIKRFSGGSWYHEGHETSKFGSTSRYVLYFANFYLLILLLYLGYQYH